MKKHVSIGQLSDNEIYVFIKRGHKKPKEYWLSTDNRKRRLSNFIIFGGINNYFVHLVPFISVAFDYPESK